MVNRIKFNKGLQRKFLSDCVIKLNIHSIRGLLQFGFNVNYNSLKNYYSERRNLPEDLFNDLCHIAKIDKSKLNPQILSANFGQALGGKKSRK